MSTSVKSQPMLQVQGSQAWFSFKPQQAFIACLIFLALAVIPEKTKAQEFRSRQYMAEQIDQLKSDVAGHSEIHGLTIDRLQQLEKQLTNQNHELNQLRQEVRILKQQSTPTKQLSYPISGYYRMQGTEVVQLSQSSDGKIIELQHVSGTKLQSANARLNKLSDGSYQGTFYGLYNSTHLNKESQLAWLTLRLTDNQITLTTEHYNTSGRKEASNPKHQLSFVKLSP